MKETVGTRGALPRLRGRGEQGIASPSDLPRAALYRLVIETAPKQRDVVSVRSDEMEILNRNDTGRRKR